MTKIDKSNSECYSNPRAIKERQHIHQRSLLCSDEKNALSR